MDGILNILKPPGMTSFDVVGYLRGLFKIKKIGHTGTLDPGAVGVLPVCIGKATKAIEFLMEKDKVYRAELTLGICTDTQDAMGKVIKTSPVNVNKNQIESVIKAFEGEYLQIPPMYSALKINGKKLYELARKGVEVEREARKVNINFIEIINIEKDKVMFEAGCSKGTYIRTLCSDIGEKLGCGAHMSFLLRSSAGIFHIGDAFTLEEIKYFYENNTLENILIDVSEIFKNLQSIKLSIKDQFKLLNGLDISSNNYSINSDRFTIYNSDGEFIALGTKVTYNDEDRIRIIKRFI